MTLCLTPTAQAVLAAFPPRHAAPDPLLGLKRLSRAEVLALEIAHIDALDRIARGTDVAQHMWDWVANVLTWSRVADLMGLAQEEMREQLELCKGVIARWQRTGRVGFDGPGYGLAKKGVEVMDALAHEVDQGTAHEAAVWTENRLVALRLGHNPTERIAA